MAKEKNVFISHHSKDDAHIGKLKTLLLTRGYTIKNSSITTRPNRIISNKVIQRLLRMRIHWAGTFICLIGKKTHTRSWVDWEIDEAHKKGKRIIGVSLYGNSNPILPSNFNKCDGILTTWNAGKIVEALEGNDPNPITPTNVPAITVKTVRKAVCNA